MTDNIFTEINIYPVPAKEYLIINGLTEKTQFTISDLTGKILLTGETVNNQKIRLNNFTSGVYMIRIDGKEDQLTKKIVVWRR